jgi:radical SAM protein with 4Fe4S-binding SPASM domain
MKKKFLDPNLKNKKNIVESNIQLVEYNNKFFPLPTEIEISESGTCNRTCSFCPRSAPDFKDLKEFITEDLFTKLCTELKNFNYKGTIRFSGFVEPMLDKNIYKLISACRDFLPSCNIELVTNGDILNLERLKKLFINGLNRILISAYDDQKTATELENLCVKAELKKNQYLVRHRYYSSEKDFGITLSNRAGLMENAEFKIKSLKEPLKLPCFIPSYTFFLNYDGDVLICPHDWGKKIILGNLKHQKFLDIWLSKKAILTRYKLSNADRKFMPCNVCDVNGTLMGKTNSDYFKNV